MNALCGWRGDRTPLKSLEPMGTSAMRHRHTHLKSRAVKRRPLLSLLTLAATVCLTAGPAPTANAQAPDSKWQSAIDATWGPGLPTERKLEIFDEFWTTIDERFAAFQDLDV